MKGNFLNLKRESMKNTQVTSYLIIKYCKLSPLEEEQDKDVHSHHFCSVSSWGVLERAVRKEFKIKDF